MADLTGQTFGDLLVLERGQLPDNRRSSWRCRCVCGTEKTIRARHLRSGVVVSCGCHRIAIHTKHNMAATPMYKVWVSMRLRCSSPRNKAWPRYGGRGITVCERWQSFENFYDDMGERPPGMTVERINNDGNYEPGNCRWATRADQTRNTSRNIFIQDGGATRTVAEWARIKGLSPNTVRRRYGRGVLPPELWGTRRGNA